MATELAPLAFFDFFGTPPPSETSDKGKGNEDKTVSYGQLKMLKFLRQSREVDKRWATHCDAAGATGDPICSLPATFVQEFLLDPQNHKSEFLKAFLEYARLDPVSVPSDVDDDDEDFGGFMDSNRFGFIQSEKWLKTEKDHLVARVNDFCAAGPDKGSTWERYCRRMQPWEDPDDEESQAVRDEMGKRSELGKRKSALDSWYDAQTKAAPPSKRKWGV